MLAFEVFFCTLFPIYKYIQHVNIIHLAPRRDNYLLYICNIMGTLVNTNNADKKHERIIIINTNVDVSDGEVFDGGS